MEILTEYISNIGNQFIDPKKRIFIAYIAISIAIAFVWFILNKKYSFVGALEIASEDAKSRRVPLCIFREEGKPSRGRRWEVPATCPGRGDASHVLK